MTLVPATSRGLSSSGGTVTGQVNIAPTGAVVNPALSITGAPAGLILNATPNNGSGGVSIDSDATIQINQNLDDIALLITPVAAQTVDQIRVNALGGTTIFNVTATGLAASKGGFQTNVITSGALPTQAFVSGTGAQASTTRDMIVATPVTFNPAAADATCKVELSPDNVTYSTLATITQKTGITNGEIELVTIPVPGAWYLKLTVTNATLGTSTKY